MSKIGDRFSTLLHSGALLLFILAMALYEMSSAAIGLGILGALFELAAWSKWLDAEKSRSEEQP